MNTSEPSRSTAAKVEAKRTALRKLFWKHQIMAHFRSLRCNAYRIELRHTTSPAEFADWLHSDRPPSLAPKDAVTYYVEPFRLGDELWAGISGKMNDEPLLRIIEPFPVPAGEFEKVAFFVEEC